MFLLLTALVTAAAPPATPSRRFALVVGTNVGDPEDERLQYAEDDARRMLDTLEDVGGVKPEDAIAIFGVDAKGLQAALDALKARMSREAAASDQLVLYVSGHADEGNLHLQGEHFPLHELNEFIRKVPAAVAILIIDSCRSGAATRGKGLRALPGTRVAIEAGSVQGRVVMGSSGADEYSQESDALKGSYFTYHLVQGLRGAADTSHDGAVTLQEAYTYAYEHTVESTFTTQGGVQHPSYHVDIVGQGELVLWSSTAGARGWQSPQPVRASS